MKKIMILFIGLLILTNIIPAQTTKTLGDTIDVLHYSINFSMLNFTSKQITGQADIQLTSRINNQNYIALELMSLTVDSVKMNNANVSYTYANRRINIPLSTPLNPSDTVIVSVYYHGIPYTGSWGGFHFETNYAYNMGVGFEENPHNLGKVWYPCIDDFTDRATYDFYITVTDTRKAVCGGILIEEINNGNGTKTFHWKISHTIPTYIASVAAGTYTIINDTFHGIQADIPITLYVKSSQVNAANASFVNLKNILTAYEGFLGPYPWERIGYTSTTIGAMEHVSNIHYPSSCIDGTLNYEYLIAHELSHMWVGNKVTCGAREDMWLNEGMATYCESLYKEGVYGEAAYKAYILDKAKKVIQFCHIIDDGYRAIYGIPHDYTYGETVYQKGACVTYTLRGYLGDSLFFDVMKQYLDTFAYQNVTSYQLRDFLSRRTGMDMTAFFDTWVFNPGFPQFSIDSFAATNTGGGNYQVVVNVRQKLRGTTLYANNNRIPITFMNNQWQRADDILQFSGATGTDTFTIPFNPTMAFLDLDQKLCDATTDLAVTAKLVGVYTMTHAYQYIDVQQISDSAFIRVCHHFVKPDTIQRVIPYFKMSTSRYWHVDGIFPSNFLAKGRFFYNNGYNTNNGYLDHGLITSKYDTTVLLYRPDVNHDWQIEPTTISGSWQSGYLITDTLKKGEYTIGVLKNQTAIWEEKKTEQPILKIAPNPSNSDFHFACNLQQKTFLKIFDTNGKLLQEFFVSEGNQSFQWKPKYQNSNCYIVKLQDIATQEIIQTEKICYVE